MLSLATSVYRELVSSLLLRVLLGLVVVWLSQWMWSRRRLYATSWQIPGPLALPFLGNAVQLGAFSSHQNMINCLARMKDHYGGFWRIWMGPALCVVITEADDFENILMSKATSIKGGKYKLLTTGMGNGLVTLSGEKWKHHRNMINPVFSSKRMKGYQNVHNKNSGRLVHGMKEICNKGYNDVSAIAMRYAADETCHGLFELKTKFYEGNDDFILALTRWAAFMTFERICKVWLSSDIAYRFTTHHKMFMYFRNLYHAFYNTKILDTIKRINESKSKPSSERIDGSADNLQREDKSDKSDNGITLSDETGDNQLTVMSVLSEALRQGEITEEDVFGEFHNFLTAAIDTMTIQVSSFMLLMAMHPVYQERVWREIKELFQDDLDGDVTTEHLTQLPFLDHCMKETMRLFATGPLQLRYLNEDFYLKSRNVTLPAGTNIALCNFLLHKNPKYWKDPHLFMPDRFADNSTKRPHFSFVPFSAGQRNCIAQVYGNDSFKTAAIHIIRNYVFYTDQRIENLTFISNVSVRSGIGYNLKVFKRDQTL